MNTNIKMHWSFWVITAIALVFNLMGCINFFMQMNPDSVAEMPEQYRLIIESRPTWATAAFAVAVFGGALGAFLLLFRKSAAIVLFIASLIGSIVAQLPLMSIDGVPVAALIGGLVQVVVIAFMIWYSKRMLSTR